ncbi:hypothetical protein FZC83_02190 [Rossellomorea marisflavi]|uniref:Uncharacterized protein n=1 Tax=Rossellomorea marisflavi TaxID=189381 RepID=A0A5D4S3S3_9BACI|nr:hypothetical protein [Rossellomorea marisflavi]TYS56406.1 hypothetical protein FZC83_02190 [Rossellomorea marisflavi]
MKTYLIRYECIEDQKHGMGKVKANSWGMAVDKAEIIINNIQNHFENNKTFKLIEAVPIDAITDWED